ncbi:MAG TPA: hypothetical protein VEB21_12345, partial [Terriglobales bacterium]|nr:hypothetical protein [Terriglobales bacterium]
PRRAAPSAGNVNLSQAHQARQKVWRETTSKASSTNGRSRLASLTTTPLESCFALKPSGRRRRRAICARLA